MLKLIFLSKVYISAIEAGHAKIEGPWPSVQRATGQAAWIAFESRSVQALSFNCPGCSNVTYGWLGEEMFSVEPRNCSRIVAMQVMTASSARQPSACKVRFTSVPMWRSTGDKTRWTLPIDATPLTTGSSLRWPFHAIPNCV